MKKLNYLLLLGLLVSFISITGCKKDDKDETEEEKKLKLLTKTWVVQSIDANGTAVTPSETVEITVTGNKTYTITGLTGLSAVNNEDKLKASGSFTFASNAQKLVLDNGTEITITSLTATAFNFQYQAKYPKATSENVLIKINTTAK